MNNTSRSQRKTRESRCGLELSQRGQMPTHLKKNRKDRGHVSAGKGRVGPRQTLNWACPNPGRIETGVAKQSRARAGD